MAAALTHHVVAERLHEGDQGAAANDRKQGHRRVPFPRSSARPPSVRRGITPAFGYDAPHPGARGTPTLLIHALPSAHYGMFRRPIAPPDALRCLRLSVPSAHGRFAPFGAPWCTEGRGLLLSAPLSPLRLTLRWKPSDLPSSWGTLMYVPCSQTPAGPSPQALTTRRYGLPLLAQRQLPRLRFFRGSITRPIHSLSTLRRMDHSTTTQNSLPAVGHTLPDRMLLPARSQRKVSAIHRILLSQAFLGASQTNPFAASALQTSSPAYNTIRSRRLIRAPP